MNGALNEWGGGRRRGLKRERGLATPPLPSIHWPIILTNGLCSHRALCFHSLPRWAKIELPSSARNFYRASFQGEISPPLFFFLSRYFFGEKIGSDSLERIYRVRRKDFCEYKCVVRRVKKDRVLVLFLVTLWHLSSIVRRKIVDSVVEKGGTLSRFIKYIFIE